MALGVLNNISAINAQNNLSNTQASLSKTLQQLSSGSRINSGADDAAGLSLANGLQASSTALSQSAKNASEGVDFLQVADGALSQVTSLLNRAITLATEASNGTLNGSQVAAANSEYQKILTETDTINNNTEYNGINTFAKNAAYSMGSATDKIDLNTDTAGTVVVGAGTAKITMASTGQTLNIEGSTLAVATTSGVIAANGTGQIQLSGATNIKNLADTINQQFGTSVAAVQGGQLVLSGGAVMSTVVANTKMTESIDVNAAPVSTLTVGNASDNLLPGAVAIQVTSTGGTAASLTGAFAAAGAGGNLSQLAADINSQFGSKGVSATISGNKMTISGGTISQTAKDLTVEEVANNKPNASVAIFTSDGTISQSYNNSASDLVQASSSALSLAGTDLTSTTGAQAALTAINSAITTVAAARGTIGANINTLTAVGNVMTTQSTNTLAAMNDVTATDYGQATSDMSKYQILSQTGIAALSQANQAQQLITKLLQ
jgi:flagellin